MGQACFYSTVKLVNAREREQAVANAGHLGHRFIHRDLVIVDELAQASSHLIHTGPSAAGAMHPGLHGSERMSARRHSGGLVWRWSGSISIHR